MIFINGNWLSTWCQWSVKLYKNRKQQKHEAALE